MSKLIYSMPDDKPIMFHIEALSKLPIEEQEDYLTKNMSVNRYILLKTLNKTYSFLELFSMGHQKVYELTWELVYGEKF